MKIIAIINYLPKSPKEIGHSFIFDEIYRLSLNGLEVHVIENRKKETHLNYGIIYHGIKNSLLRSFPFMLKHLGAIPPIGYLIPLWKILDPYRYGYSVSDIVKAEDGDIIHAHFAYSEGLAGLIAKRETGKPLVVTLRGYDILTETSVGYGIRLDKRYDYIIRNVLREADAIITWSSATFNEARNIVVDKQKIHLISNGVDLKKFNPNINGQHNRIKYDLEEKFIVLSLKSHKPQYGLEYLIRAIPSVIKHSNQIFFIFGGDGSLRAYLESLSKSLGITKHIMFTGYIPRNYIPFFYAASDVVVVPSLQEGFGLVVTEAMASGKPVIGSNVGGIPDQIIDGYNGFLIKPRDPQSISKKILYLYDNPRESRKMGYMGRKIAEQKFDINNKINGVIEVYNQLVTSA